MVLLDARCMQGRVKGENVKRVGWGKGREGWLGNEGRKGGSENLQHLWLKGCTS